MAICKLLTKYGHNHNSSKRPSPARKRRTSLLIQISRKGVHNLFTLLVNNYRLLSTEQLDEINNCYNGVEI